jgi:hypothetical protein
MNPMEIPGFASPKAHIKQVGGAFPVFYIDPLFKVCMVGVAQLVER